MDTKTIHTFLTVVNTGSIKAAADKLNYAASTVSNQIHTLESELPYPLFDRSSNRLRLTAFGYDFMAYAEEIDRIALKISELNENSLMMHYNLDVCIYESLMMSTIPEVLSEYKKMHPNVFVKATTDIGNPQMAQLKKNVYDMAYIANEVITDPLIECLYKRKEEVVFVANINHPLASKKVSLEEIFRYPQIRMEHDGACYNRLMSIVQTYEQTPYFSLAVENINCVIGLLQYGNEISFLPLFSIEKQLENGLLTVLDVDIPPQYYYAQVLIRKGKWLPKYAHDFIDKIREFYPESE